MPEVIVYAVEGRKLEQKRGLVKDITDAVVRNFGVPADAVVVQIVEFRQQLQGQGRRALQRAPAQPLARRSRGYRAARLPFASWIACQIR